LDIIIGFFAAVGLLYLLRDLASFMIYRKKRACCPVRVDLSDMDRERFCDLMNALCDILGSSAGKSAVWGVELFGEGFDVREAEELARLFGIRVRLCDPRISPRSYEAPGPDFEDRRAL